MRTGRFETFEGERRGEFFWRLLAGNGETIAVSESYGSRSDAERGALDLVGVVTDLVLEAGHEDLVEVYEA